MGDYGHYGQDAATVRNELAAHETAVRDRHRRNEDSGDTDANYLGISAKAEQLTAALIATELDLAERGWTAGFWVLQDLEGNDVPGARVFVNPYDKATWLVPKQGGPAEFLGYRPARESTLENKGYRETLRQLPAYAKLESEGRGTSGLLNTRVSILPHPDSGLVPDERRGTIRD